MNSDLEKRFKAEVERRIGEGSLARPVTEKATAPSSAFRMIADVQANSVGEDVTGPFNRPGDRNPGAVDGLGAGRREQRDVGGADPKRTPLDYGPSLSSSKGDLNIATVVSSMKAERATNKASDQTVAANLIANGATSPALEAARLVNSTPHSMPTQAEIRAEVGPGAIDSVTAACAIARIQRRRVKSWRVK
ncbi:MAG: hypothetical protein WCB99_04155 [Candidatus Cybelea sp.]